jgi:hypothetical protein
LLAREWIWTQILSPLTSIVYPPPLHCIALNKCLKWKKKIMHQLSHIFNSFGCIHWIVLFYFKLFLFFFLILFIVSLFLIVHCLNLTH